MPPGTEGWQPLAGLRVVDFAMFVPGPFASAIFADLGAEVIKIEALGGDPARRYIPAQFRTENRNKRGLAIDLKAELRDWLIEQGHEVADLLTPAQIEEYRALLETATVGIEAIAKPSVRDPRFAPNP